MRCTTSNIKLLYLILINITKSVQSIPISRSYLDKNKFVSFDCDVYLEDDYDIKNKDFTREFKTTSLNLQNQHSLSTPKQCPDTPKEIKIAEWDWVNILQFLPNNINNEWDLSITSESNPSSQDCSSSCSQIYGKHEHLKVMAREWGITKPWGKYWKFISADDQKKIIFKILLVNDRNQPSQSNKNAISSNWWRQWWDYVNTEYFNPSQFKSHYANILNCQKENHDFSDQRCSSTEFVGI